MQLTREYLEWLFHYDRENGKLYWKNHWCKNKHRLIGKEAGCIENLPKGGYYRISIETKRFLTHRIIYFLEHECWPEIVDHINGNTLDNRPCNLRAADDRKNQSNRKRHRIGRLVGAHWRSDKQVYESRITVNKKRFFLGYFDTELEAHLAYLSKGIKLGVL